MGDRRYAERPLVYLAAPYSHPDPAENTNRVIALADELLDEGLVTPVVPHLTMLWHVVRPRPLDDWYAYDLAILGRCDALLRMPGQSAGADQEVEYARARDIPTFDDREALNHWCQER